MKFGYIYTKYLEGIYSVQGEACYEIERQRRLFSAQSVPIPEMLKNENDVIKGRIINIASIAGDRDPNDLRAIQR